MILSGCCNAPVVLSHDTTWIKCGKCEQQLEPPTDPLKDRIRKLVRRFWHWRNRGFWAQMEATNTLQNAHTYLARQYWDKASTQSRGYLLPEAEEALEILTRLSVESLERALEL